MDSVNTFNESFCPVEWRYAAMALRRDAASAVRLCVIKPNCMCCVSVLQHIASGQTVQWLASCLPAHSMLYLGH